MTIRSTFNGIIRVPTSFYGDSDPVDTANVRDGIVNNAIHTAEESGQVLVNTILPDGVTVTSGEPTSSYHKVVTFGPFPLSLRADGSTFRIRTRVLGYSDDNTATVVFLVVLAPFLSGVGAIGANAGGVASGSTSSTTEAWIDMTNDYGDLLYMDAARVLSSQYPLTTPTSVGGSYYTQTPAILACLHVYSVQASASNAVVGGVYAAEYAG